MEALPRASGSSTPNGTNSAMFAVNSIVAKANQYGTPSCAANPASTSTKPSTRCPSEGSNTMSASATANAARRRRAIHCAAMGTAVADVCAAAVCAAGSVAEELTRAWASPSRSVSLLTYPSMPGESDAPERPRHRGTHVTGAPTSPGRELWSGISVASERFECFPPTGVKYPTRVTRSPGVDAQWSAPTGTLQRPHHRTFPHPSRIAVQQTTSAARYTHDP